ncbi:acyl carrier protein [Mycolicibacterium iranicum]|uniref:Acyl carrier protein n=1 Tax=Mycolicibacterium iranicum TaxID=912594 RepID=A0A1X1WVK1_MYCIR|nr:acyl carrier protein [Mycolicibacterium iranicum]MCZ0730112.1 acyl carrier protein [Mycolicibacterium iranicum]ORV90621.1 acyl carrier protein [Mycolicibacterium iranicum]
MMFSQDTLDRVIVVVAKTLGIQDRAHTLEATTELFGSLPELDSMSVVALSVNLEREFDFEIDDEDFTGEVFDSVGTLAAYVEQNKQTQG